MFAGEGNLPASRTPRYRNVLPAGGGCLPVSNSVDRDGVRELVSAGARLNVAERFCRQVLESSLLLKLRASALAIEFPLGELDGEPLSFSGLVRHMDAELAQHANAKDVGRAG